MNKEKELSIKGKLNFYCEESIKVHIIKTDGFFWNGHILGKRSDDVYNFDEDKLGNCFLFVSDIDTVNEFKDREK